MISEQMQQLVKGSSVIRAMFEEGKIMAKKYGAENVYDFSLGNPSVEPPAEVKRAMIDVLEALGHEGAIAVPRELSARMGVTGAAEIGL